MSDYYYGSYIGPIDVLFGRCAVVRPCKETYEEPNDIKMVVAQFDLPAQHPKTRQPMNYGWHKFEASDFQKVKPLPE